MSESIRRLGPLASRLVDEAETTGVVEVVAKLIAKEVADYAENEPGPDSWKHYMPGALTVALDVVAVVKGPWQT